MIFCERGVKRNGGWFGVEPGWQGSRPETVTAGYTATPAAVVVLFQLRLSLSVCVCVCVCPNLKNNSARSNVLNIKFSGRTGQFQGRKGKGGIGLPAGFSFINSENFEPGSHVKLLQAPAGPSTGRRTDGKGLNRGSSKLISAELQRKFFRI